VDALVACVVVAVVDGGVVVSAFGFACVPVVVAAVEEEDEVV